MTFTIENGRGRLIVNSHGPKCHVTLDVNGAGYSLFLERRQMLELGAALLKAAYEDKPHQGYGN